MASATSKSAAEILGMEYDWLGCDSNGHIALFSTAGVGYAPAEFLRDTDAHDVAIQEVLALPPTTEARFFPAVAPGLVNTWRLVAERGLYAYDCDPNGGPYHLVAAPVVAAKTDALPPEVVSVATRVRCPAPFERQTVVTEQMLGAHS
jgi:hypothetical protein